MFPAREVDGPEELSRPADLVVARSKGQYGCKDVVQCRERWQEVIPLEDEPDAAVVGCQLFASQCGDFGGANPGAARVWCLDGAQEVQQR